MMGHIAFENLRAEMGRRQLTIAKIASTIGMNRDTLGRKLSRNAPLNLDEAFYIVKACFPDRSVEYIFCEALAGSNKSTQANPPDKAS